MYMSATQGDNHLTHIESINAGFQKQELSESQKFAILTLLYKKGDKQCLDNWRPILQGFSESIV